MVVGHVDGGEIQLLEHVLLHLSDLVPRHVDGVREPESREHLEVQLGEEVAAEIDSSDPERSRHYLHQQSSCWEPGGRAPDGYQLPQKMRKCHIFF